MNWYLIRTATRQEERAEAGLKELGVEFYYPTYRRFERIGRQPKREERRRPLFPGYMFVLTKDGQFADVEAVDAVHAFVRYTSAAGDRCPLAVNLSLLVELQDRVASEEHDEADPYAIPDFEIGERVQITSGHYQGYWGEVRQLSSDKRVKVMLEAVTRGGWAWQVEVDKPHLAKVA